MDVTVQCFTLRQGEGWVPDIATDNDTYSVLTNEVWSAFLSDIGGEKVEGAPQWLPNSNSVLIKFPTYTFQVRFELTHEKRIYTWNERYAFLFKRIPYVYVIAKSQERSRAGFSEIIKSPGEPVYLLINPQEWPFGESLEFWDFQTKYTGHYLYEGGYMRAKKGRKKKRKENKKKRQVYKVKKWFKMYEIRGENGICRFIERFHSFGRPQKIVR